MPMRLPKTIKEMSLIICAGVISALLVNFFSPGGVALIGEWDASKGVVNAKSKERPIQHDIEIDDIRTVKKLYDSGSVIFVDARAGHLYQKKHVKGAVSLPLEQFDANIEPFLTAYPPSAELIIYCSGRECDEAHRLAQSLIDIGYERLRVFIDGFEGWRQAGYPVQ
jgi:rhodanese-related sulfurtransferase